MAQPQIPLPTPDESFERYSIRAHQALADSGMDVHQRSQLVRYTWHQHRGLTEEEEVARQTFDPAKYRYVPDVVVFAEHETIDKQGRPRKYGLAELAQIVKDCNARVVNRGVFAAISDGHTSNPGDPVKRDPAILGWAGPVRLGIVDRHKPTWGILTDEYHIKEAAPILDRKPRRSVELWTFRNGAEMHFDPVAAIGAEAPRLPLPMRYSFGSVAADDGKKQPQLDRYSVASVEGGQVEKYTFCAAEHYDAEGGGGTGGGFAFPGAANTHVRSFGCKSKPTKYAETPVSQGQPQGASPMDDMGSNAELLARLGRIEEQLGISNGGGGGSTSPDAIELAKEVVGFLKQTPQFQFLDELMAQQGGAAMPGNASIDDLAAAPPGAPGAEDATPSAPGPSGPPEPAPEGAAPTDAGGGAPGQEDDLSDIIDQVGDEGGGQPPPHAEPDGDETATPQPKEKDSMSYAQPQGGLVEKYTALQSSHEKAMAELMRANARIDALEKSNADLMKSRADAHRRMKIGELAGKYQLNEEEETQRWLFSNNANAGNDGDFDAFCTVIEKYAARQVENHTLPEGSLAPTEQPVDSAEKYAAECRPELMKVHAEFVASGKDPDYAAEMAVVRERLAARGINPPKK